MLYDLNIPWTPTTTQADLQRTLTFLTTLNYNTIALNHTLSLPLPSQLTSPLPAPSTFNLPPTTTLLTRCTILISDPTQNHRLPHLVQSYSLVAIRPTTLSAFEKACTSLTDHSLISLDLTTRFPFHFKPKPCMAAIHRGIRFEICYAQFISGSESGRRNFIANFMELRRATRGRGLVVSSEARGALGIRGAADVGNLLGVWGLERERVGESMGVNVRGVVVNEGLKRTSFRGVVDVVEGGEDPWVKEQESLKENSKAKNDGKKSGENGNGNTNGNEGQEEKLSKRALKRLKAEAKKTQTDTSPSPAPATPKDSENTPISKPSPLTNTTKRKLDDPSELDMAKLSKRAQKRLKSSAPTASADRQGTVVKEKDVDSTIKTSTND